MHYLCFVIVAMTFNAVFLFIAHIRASRLNKLQPSGNWFGLIGRESIVLIWSWIAFGLWKRQKSFSFRFCCRRIEQFVLVVFSPSRIWSHQVQVYGMRWNEIGWWSDVICEKKLFIGEQCNFLLKQWKATIRFLSLELPRSISILFSQLSEQN